jgi:hypothetical protein
MLQRAFISLIIYIRSFTSTSLSVEWRQVALNNTNNTYFFICVARCSRYALRSLAVICRKFHIYFQYYYTTVKMLNTINNRIYTRLSLVINDNIYVAARLAVARRSANQNLSSTKFERYICRKTDGYWLVLIDVAFGAII